MTQWTCQPIFESYVVVGLLTLCLVVVLLVGPAFGRLNANRRRMLWVLRAGVIGLVVLAMLRPTRISTTAKQQSAVLLVLLDQSRSMELPHTSGGKSRWRMQREALEQVQSKLQSLAKEFDVKVYAYDQKLNALTLSNGQVAFPERPAGDQTDIGSTLDEAVQRERDRRLAAVILLGDGAQTAFAPRVEVQEAGRALARLEYPLYTVTFGPSGDPEQARDVSLENLPEQYTVFVKNELPIKGMLRVRGYLNQEIPVELTVRDNAGKTTVTQTRRLQARQDGQQVPVQFVIVPDQPGQYKVTLKAADQPGELVTSNNELSAFLTVLEGGLRVLYLYGDLLGEQRLLRRSIDASPDIQLDDVFVDPKNRDRWPVDFADLLTAARFDVLMLECVDAAAFRETDLQAVAKAVEQGKGLIMLGGYNSFGPGGYFNTPLADVLPIVMDRFERQEIGVERPLRRDLHLWSELPMRPTARPHPVMRLARDEDNDEIWRSLPPLQGANRFSSVKPRAQVLAETPDREALLVSGEYGKGRSLAFAGNSTRRWWQYGRQVEHRRFWRQIILWLARRDDAAQNDVWIKLAQRRYNRGEQVSFTAGVRSASGDVLRGATFQVQLVSPRGERQPVPVVAEEENVRGTISRIDQPGDYQLEVEAEQGGQKLGKTQTSFQLLDRDAELSNPAANYDLMARLAHLTKAAGGRPLAPEQLPELLAEIERRKPELKVEVQSRWQLADTDLDAWLFLLVLLALLTTEWVFRKRWGMV